MEPELTRVCLRLGFQNINLKIGTGARYCHGSYQRLGTMRMGEWMAEEINAFFVGATHLPIL
jgi:hypothetical protein